MDKKLHVPVVIGTARLGRQSDKVAEFVATTIASNEGVTTEVVDVKDHVTDAITTPPWGEGGANDKPTAWKGIVEKSDALILVVPEYNHSFPGELKLLLDSLWEDYKGMPVAIVGVSKGILGGARVIDHLKQVLIELKLTPIRESVNFLKVEDAFNPDGTIVNEKVIEYVNKMLEELMATANLLAPLRK